MLLFAQIYIGLQIVIRLIETGHNWGQGQHPLAIGGFMSATAFSIVLYILLIK